MQLLEFRVAAHCRCQSLVWLTGPSNIRISRLLLPGAAAAALGFYPGWYQCFCEVRLPQEGRQMLLHTSTELYVEL